MLYLWGVQKYKPVKGCFYITFMSWKHGVRSYSSGSLTKSKIVFEIFSMSWCFIHVRFILMRIWDDFVLNFNTFWYSLHTLILNGPECALEKIVASIWKVFLYDDMDTANHVEWHWELIKYIPLQEKVNWSLIDLIMAIIGSIKDDTRLGQRTLLNQFKMIQ